MSRKIGTSFIGHLDATLFRRISWKEFFNNQAILQQHPKLGVPTG